MNINYQLNKKHKCRNKCSNKYSNKYTVYKNHKQPCNIS